jgi:hypothetical protein
MIAFSTEAKRHREREKRDQREAKRIAKETARRMKLPLQDAPDERKRTVPPERTAMSRSISFRIRCRRNPPHRIQVPTG